MGYLNFKGQEIIVIGKSLYGIFEKSSESKVFEYLECSEGIKEDRSAPPVISEPIVWKYVYENGKVTFIGAEMYDLYGEQ